ncbi:MAG: thrombospondin type 3 repeat-containing protein [Acutalibacteraceae bacterium]|jgi:hypothetical protein
MAWFTTWWQSMTVLQQAFACVAIPATLLLVIQLILMLVGLGGHGDAVSGDFDGDGIPDSLETDFSADLNGDGVPDLPHDAAQADAQNGAAHGTGLRLFTLQGLVAFFAVGGWLGIVLQDAGAPGWSSVLIALTGGAAALFLVALVIRWFSSMQESGTLSLRNAIAQTGTVYLKIPPRRTGAGKVNLLVQEQLRELEAVTDNETAIPVGANVQVIGLAGENTLLVRSLSMMSSDNGRHTIRQKAN